MVNVALSLVKSGGSESIEKVMVNRRVVAERGELRTVDGAQVSRDAQAATRRLLEASGLTA